MRQPCTNGRFDGPHRCIRGGCWKSALGRERQLSTSDRKGGLPTFAAPAN